MERIDIQTSKDIIIVRQRARSLAESLGFSNIDKTRIATAVSELARNLLDHGMGGQVQIDEVSEGSHKGLRFFFKDEGPGIADIEEAMRPGFSSTNGLGCGLPGAKCLMDEFNIESEPGKGTRVVIIKWK